MGTDPVFPKQALPLEGADVFSISYSSNHQRARSANAVGDQERPSGGRAASLIRTRLLGTSAITPNPRNNKGPHFCESLFCTVRHQANVIFRGG